MLHAVDPLTAILASVRISVRSLTVLLIVPVIAFITSAVLPHIVAKAMHHARLEAALEVATISPLETTFAIHLVIWPTSRELGAISPKVDSVAFFHSVLEIAMVVATIGPDLNALSSLLFWLSYLWGRVNGFKVVLDVKACCLTEYAQPGLMILLPESLVHFFYIGRWSPEDAKATGLPIDPVTLERASVGPDQFTIAALFILVVQKVVVTLLVWSMSGMPTLRPIHLGVRVDWNHAHLTHVLEHAEFNSFKG